MLIYAASALLASKPRIRIISSIKPWGYDIRISYDFFTWQNYPFLEVWPSHDSISFRSLYLALISLRWWQWYSSDKFWFAPGGIICGWFRSRLCRSWSMSEYVWVAPIEVVSFCTFFQFHSTCELRRAGSEIERREILKTFFFDISGCFRNLPKHGYPKPGLFPLIVTI